MTHNLKAKQAAPVTPLPWEIFWIQSSAGLSARIHHKEIAEVAHIPMEWNAENDAPYIVAACNAFPRLLAEREQLVAALRNCVNAQDVTGGPKGSTELACTEGARYLLRQIEGTE